MFSNATIMRTSTLRIKSMYTLLRWQHVWRLLPVRSDYLDPFVAWVKCNNVSCVQVRHVVPFAVDGHQELLQFPHQEKWTDLQHCE